MNDDLERFVVAQAPHIDTVKAELAAGRKRTHWMWFVFPQLRGLGHSQFAWHFGLASADQARDYLAHALLGPRLRECVALVLTVPGRTAHEIFGSPDDLKLRSCLTLFREIDGADGVFGRALDQFFDGDPDPQTLRLLADAR
jgi:uncharacterized protein (DUF1810 family)